MKIISQPKNRFQNAASIRNEGFFTSDFMYAARPWAAVVFGVYALTRVHQSVWMVMPAAVLFFCAYAIFSLRRNARRNSR